MAELADALDLKSGAYGVRVRVPPRALTAQSTERRREMRLALSERLKLVGALCLCVGVVALIVINPSNIHIVGPTAIATGLLTKFFLSRRPASS